MSGDDEVRAGLTAAVSGPGRGGGPAADRLCAGCVELLDVDGAAVSIVSAGEFFSVGVCGALSGEVEQLQFTLGEGPCLDAVSRSAPVLVADLNGPDTLQWPVFAGAATRSGVRAVFALPVAVAGFPVGVLTLCRRQPGRLAGSASTGAFLAAELAVLPLLDVMGTDLHGAIVRITGGNFRLIERLMTQVLRVMDIKPTRHDHTRRRRSSQRPSSSVPDYAKNPTKLPKQFDHRLAGGNHRIARTPGPRRWRRDGARRGLTETAELFSAASQPLDADRLFQVSGSQRASSG